MGRSLSFSNSYMKHPARQSGFTMIELLVTMGIFMLLTGAVLANYKTYSTNAEFANASESIVLALRQAQVYGSSTKGNTTTCGSSGTTFECAYGVHILNGASEVVIFVDVDGDAHYSTSDSLIETITWNSLISFTSVKCGVTSCTGTPGVGAYVDITFKRPSPDAIIADSVTTISGPLTFFDKAEIVLTDTNTAKTSTITVKSAGQISVQ